MLVPSQDLRFRSTLTSQPAGHQHRLTRGTVRADTVEGVAPEDAAVRHGTGGRALTSGFRLAVRRA